MLSFLVLYNILVVKRLEMYIVDSRKKMYVKFIANQLEKPAVVVRLTNQLGEALIFTTGRKKKALNT